MDPGNPIVAPSAPPLSSHLKPTLDRAQEKQAPQVQAGPDFCCIGAQKGGTGWLYEQLRAHPDFWMPPLKELHYFDRLWRSQRKAAASRFLFMGQGAGRFDAARKSARDERDLEFLNAMESLSERSEIDLQKYGALFAAKEGLLTGDITPGYSTLQDEIIEQIVTCFPRMKVIFLARDPVERAWSNLSMWVRHGSIERFDISDADQVIRHLLRPEVLVRSHPSKIVARWRRHVHPTLFRVYFFDDLKRNPSALRRSIIEFLGGDPAQPSGELAADHNSKARLEKLELTGKVRGRMAEFFERELKTCAQELGGPALEWPSRYGF
jgi:hypothetical protein